MASFKTGKVIFWAATVFIFLIEGVGSAATANLDYAKQNVYDLGYPEYFRVALLTCKIIAALVLIIPAVPTRVKEWAYTGLFFNTLFAIISYASLGRFGEDIAFAFLLISVLIVSYLCFHKLHARKIAASGTG